MTVGYKHVKLNKLCVCLATNNPQSTIVNQFESASLTGMALNNEFVNVLLRNELDARNGIIEWNYNL